jgi:hypothetical protein
LRHGNGVLAFQRLVAAATKKDRKPMLDELSTRIATVKENLAGMRGYL